MNKYEKEVVQAELNAEKEVLKALEKNYENALQEVDSKIAMLLGRGDADMQHVVYQVEYQKAIRKQITAILDQLHNDEFLTVSEYLTACYNEGVMGELYILQQQGIPLMFPIDQEQVVAALQHDTALDVDLYTHLGKNITVLKKQIAEEITRGISTGMMYNEITRNLKDYARISKNRAATIVRTEGHRIQIAAQKNTMQKAKDAGADIVKVWNATLDAKTRPSHAKVDGETRELHEKFSNGMYEPADKAGGAAEVINCRCRLGRTARWALDVEKTKHLGNTDKMTDKQLKPTADQLGITVEELRKYKDNIIPVKAKNYDDFRRQYEKIWNYEPVKAE
jgi:SPP1 gp7 family putative phage head morphogenesis protein